MGTLLSVLPWVLASVVVGVGIGFYLGLTAGPQKKQGDKADRRQEAATLNVLSNVLAAAEQLNHEVGTHNTEIEAWVRQWLGDLCCAGRVGATCAARKSSVDG